MAIDEHPTEAALGYGLSLMRGATTGGSTTYTHTGLEIKDFQAPEISRDTVDVTNHRSPGGFLEYIPSLLDAGEVTFTVNYVPALSADPEHALGELLADLYAAGNKDYRIMYTDGTTEDFTGSVTGFSRAIPVNDAMTADVTMKVSGKPELKKPTSGPGTMSQTQPFDTGDEYEDAA